MPVSARSIVVATGGPHGSLQQAQALLASVLNHGGCPACLSGIDIHFVNETQFFTHNVNLATQQVRIEG